MYLLETNKKKMVGESRFELPASRTPSECAIPNCATPRRQPNLTEHAKKAREKFEQGFNLAFDLAHDGLELTGGD